MPAELADNMVELSGGDPAALEQLLGLNPGDLGSNLVRIDIPDPSGLRMPSGNEYGANDNWLPGGYTSGGTPEAVIDSPPPGEYIVTPIIKH